MSGTNTIAIQPLGTSLPLVRSASSAPSGLTGTFEFFVNNSYTTTENLTVGGFAYALSLSNSGTTETLTIGPAVTQNPLNRTVSLGGNTSFTAAASGTPRPQWYVSTNGGTTFATVSNTGVYGGATTGTLTITGATSAMNGYLYEAKFTSGGASVYTTAATLTVLGAPVATQNPASEETVFPGAMATLTAAAAGISQPYRAVEI